MDKDYNGNPKEVYDEVQVKFDADCDFLTSYYRDELNAKGIDADYDVRLIIVAKIKVQLITKLKLM